MKNNNTKVIGDFGEDTAVRYLEKKGMNLIARNFRGRYGEIDAVMREGEYTVFVEVKLRRRNSLISGTDCVDRGKRKRIIKTAFEYICETGDEGQPRFDVVEVKTDFSGKPVMIKHIENAFDTEEEYASF